MTTTTPSPSASTFSSGARKYLCSAPRPEVWDDYVDQVLPHLGETAAEQEATLRKTMEHIQTLHGDIQPRRGPGRKSNAEHALHFYNYLLEQIGERKRGKKRKKHSNQELIMEEERPAIEEFTGQHHDYCDVCEQQSSKLVLCWTCPRGFHVPCARPVLEKAPTSKTWRCAYCVLSTEPKHTKNRKQAAAAVRLMARLRNQFKRNKQKLKEVLEEIEEEEKGDQKQEEKDEQVETMEAEKIEDDKRKDRTEKTESEASVETAEEQKKEDGDALKAETRMDVEHTETEEGKADELHEQKDTKQPASPEKTPSSPESKSKRNLALFRLSDSLSPGLKVEPSSGGRGKRTRKQPVLYDPQKVSAREWQSDELEEYKKPAADDSKEEEESSSTSVKEEDDKIEKEKADNEQVKDSEQEDEAAIAAQASRRASRDRGDSVWCNFCGDDPAIKVCCFCACRVCFGKHNQTKLLICDMCDDEYHTFCLDPPLASVPSEEKWFCPSCTASQEKRAARTSSRTRGLAKKREEEEASPSPRRSSSRTTAASAKKADSGGSRRGPGRPRGRPAKSPSPPKSGSTGKKRGRPPKSASGSRKRGRPPKSKSPSAGRGSGKTATAKKSVKISRSVQMLSSVPLAAGQENAAVGATVGSAASTDASASLLQETSGPPLPPVPVTVSRSGRTVRRSSFHDEIEEKDQHLRSEKYALEMQRKATAAAIAVGTVPGGQANSSSLTTDLQGSAGTIVTAGMHPRISVADTSSVQQVGASVSQGTAAFSNLGSLVTPGALQGAANVSMSSVPGAFASNPLLQTTAEPSVSLPSSLNTITAATLQPVSVSGGSTTTAHQDGQPKEPARVPRRKPGARECMQLSRRFGAHVISQNNMGVLLDYCQRGKVEHLIRMRERLDDHSRFLESQLAGLEALVKAKGESDVVVPALPAPEHTR